MGTTKPLVKVYTPLLCRIERKVAASSMFLSYSGRMQLVNSVIASQTTFYSCMFKLPASVIKEIDIYRKIASG